MRTILMSFEDNEAAEVFAKTLDQLKKREYPGLTDEGVREVGMLLQEEGVTLDAMVARPTKACECSGKPAGRKVGYVQTKRYHWWVHGLKSCKKPTQYIVDNFISILMGGNRDILGEVVPDHVEVPDNLDLDARIRVVNQELRNSRKYTLPEVRSG